MTTRRSNAVRKDEMSVTPTKGKSVTETQPHLVKNTPDASPAEGLSESFKRKAEKLDKKIRAIVGRIESDYVALGEHFNEMNAGGFHVALGFPRFENYLAEVIPQKGKSQVFQAMRIVRELTSGDKPVATKEELLAMPRTNAESLAKLHSKGKEITTDMISAAQSMPMKEFQEKVVDVQLKAPVRQPAPAPASGPAGAEANPAPSEPESQAEVLLKRKILNITEETLEELDLCYKIGVVVCGDDDRTIPLEDKILQAMCAEFRAANEAQYNAWLEDDAATSRHRALEVSNAMGPESAEEQEETSAVLVAQEEVEAEILEEATHEERVVELDPEAVTAGE